MEVVCVKGAQGFFFFQAEDGIRDLVRSRGLGDVYKRQAADSSHPGIFRGGLEHPAREPEQKDGGDHGNIR